MRELVCFFVHGLELAVPIEDVRETIGVRAITPVFHTPPSVAGVTSLRGEILAVLDLGALLGLAPNVRDEDSRIVIVKRGGREAGLLVDRLADLRQIPDDVIGAPPPTLSSRAAAVLSGVASLPERPIGIVDVDRVFDAPELAPLAARPAPAASRGGVHAARPEEGD